MDEKQVRTLEDFCKKYNLEMTTSKSLTGKKGPAFQSERIEEPVQPKAEKAEQAAVIVPKTEEPKLNMLQKIWNKITGKKTPEVKPERVMSKNEFTTQMAADLFKRQQMIHEINKKHQKAYEDALSELAVATSTTMDMIREDFKKLADRKHVAFYMDDKDSNIMHIGNDATVTILFGDTYKLDIDCKVTHIIKFGSYAFTLSYLEGFME